MSGDFKVTGINDAGTPVKHGANDLDNINRILHGENLNKSIIINNKFTFKHNKLVIRDFSGNNEIRIGSSEENADWSTSLPVLGGKRVPLFRDLTQTITLKNINAGNNTITNIDNDDIKATGNIDASARVNSTNGTVLPTMSRLAVSS